MRFLAVFIQRDMPCAVGFEDLTDAIALLFWGYEEDELLPCGIYDLLTGDTLPYQHRGQGVGPFEPDLVRRTATQYVRAATRLSRNPASQTEPSPGRTR